jgi:hypothetical protein
VIHCALREWVNVANHNHHYQHYKIILFVYSLALIIRGLTTESPIQRENPIKLLGKKIFNIYIHSLRSHPSYKWNDKE